MQFRLDLRAVTIDIDDVRNNQGRCHDHDNNDEDCNSKLSHHLLR